jgi:hypothetical protein
MPDDVVDRVVRNANEYLKSVEADRGAIHKSLQNPGARQKAGGQP